MTPNTQENETTFDQTQWNELGHEIQRISPPIFRSLTALIAALSRSEGRGDDARVTTIMRLVDRALAVDPQSLDILLRRAEPFTTNHWRADDVRTLFRLLCASTPEIDELAVAANDVDAEMTVTMLAAEATR